MAPKYDNIGLHTRQARAGVALPAKMSKGGDRGPYISDQAAGEMYDLMASDRGPMTPKEAGANTWHAIHAITPVSDGTAVGTVPSLIRTPADDLTQATGTKQPLYRKAGANNRPYLEFDGVDDQLNGGLNPTAVSSGQPFVLMIVGAQRTTPTGPEDWWCGNFGPKAVKTSNSDKRFSVTGDATNNVSITSTLLWTLGTPQLLTITSYGAGGVAGAGGIATLRINGEIEGASSPLFGMDLNVQNIGNQNDGLVPAHLNYYESCYWGFLPGQRTIASVEKYLLQTYGL